MHSLLICFIILSIEFLSETIPTTVERCVLTGVGVTFPVIMLISAFSALIGMGGGPRASIAMGEKRNDDAEKILTNCFFALIGIALILTVFFSVFNEPLLLKFGANEDTIGYASS